MFGKNHYLPENNAETLQKIFSMCCKKNKQSIIRKNSTKLSVNNFFVEGKNNKTWICTIKKVQNNEKLLQLMLEMPERNLGMAFTLLLSATHCAFCSYAKITLSRFFPRISSPPCEDWPATVGWERDCATGDAICSGMNRRNELLRDWNFAFCTPRLQ